MSVAKKAKLDLETAEKDCNVITNSRNGTERCNHDKHVPSYRDEGTSSELNGTDLSKGEIMKMRKAFIGKSCKVHFKKDPIKIEFGKGQYLFDEKGQRYLDCINNVTQVGHCHPHVVKAAQDQMAILNTNNRFLYDNMVTYAKRLVSKLPPSLSVCYFVCTGSEANDLALRISRNHTKAKDIVILDRAYHGHTSLLIDVSPYKYNAPGGEGKKDFVHAVPTPDAYHGKHQGKPTAELGEKYALEVKEAIDCATTDGRKIAAFLVESFQGCGGQIIYPPHYLRDAFKYIREVGGVCIADEIQVGFGRVGKHFWAFESQGVVPDIVTLGKPIGNGHPLAVVVTTPELAESFAATGMSYFNTYGGNPVSCAVGNAVLDVIENENLQKHALELGQYLVNKLEVLKEKYTLIGDVRGMGLFIGVELVRDRQTKEPATSEAHHLVYRAKEEMVLISSDGIHDNVLKIKPPLCFSYEDADHLVNVLDKLLREVEAAKKRDI